MRSHKRYDVSGEDMFEATRTPRGDADYHLAWFDALEDAVAYADRRIELDRRGRIDHLVSIAVHRQDRNDQFLRPG